MNIAVAGNQWITEYLLNSLVRSGCRPSLILNIPPERSSNISGYVDLQTFGDRHGIDVYRPAAYHLKTDTDERALASREIDTLLVFGWQRLIPEWLIVQCRRGVYGVHGGPEKPPRCRGRAVFNWAILLGYSRFYMYLFRITPEVDAGKIVELTEFDITPYDDSLSIYHKNCVVSTRMFINNLPAILNGTVQLINQPGGTPTYLPKRSRESGGICWDDRAIKIANLIRAIAPPYPGAFTILGDMEVNIYQAHLFDTKIIYPNKPGMVVDVFPNGDFVVMTGDYPLYVRTYACADPSALISGAVFQRTSGVQLPEPNV